MHGPNSGPDPGKRAFRVPQIEWWSHGQVSCTISKVDIFGQFASFTFPAPLAVVGGRSTPLLCLLSLVRGTSNTYRAESTMAEAEEGGGPRLITLRDGFGAWGDVPALLRSEIFKRLPRGDVFLCRAGPGRK